MLDPEYVKRIDREMEESGGQLAPDDHEGIWANLKSCDEWRAELEFAIALLTDMSLDEVREMTLNEAAERHPTLSRVEALKAEIRIRDAIQRAVETRNLLYQCARVQNNSDVKGRQGPWPDIHQGTGSDQDRHDESTGRVECLTDRLTRTTSFDASRTEWIRQRELSLPRPDYGTFLRDEELIELFPEAAAHYHVDDIRRALMMIHIASRE